MTIVQAIQVLFAQTAPAGVNIASEAFDALKGKKDSDLSPADVATPDDLAETFQDFVGDPAGWLKKASPADVRRSWWVQLAQALGVSVSSTTAPGAAPAAALASAPVVQPEPDAAPDIEPEQGIDPDALAGGAPAPGRRESGGGGGGVVVSSSDDRDDVTSREAPAILLEILAYSSYKSWSAVLIETFRLIRSGTPAEQAQKRAEIPHARSLIESMKLSTTPMEVQTGFHLERLLETLERGRDQREPAWFQANYVTGTYAD